MAKKPKKGVTALSPQHEDPLWNTLDEKIGGREGLLQAAMASPNPKAAFLAELLLDKAFSRSGTKVLAKKADMGADEIVDLYRNKKWLEATLALHEQLPDIIHGAAADAKPKMVPCAECKGQQKTEDGKTCWICGGWGEVRRPGDKDKLKFIGDAVGLTGKVAPAVQNNIQVNAPGTNQTVSFDEMMRRATIQVTRQPRQIETAEVIEDVLHDTKGSN